MQIIEHSGARYIVLQGVAWQTVQLWQDNQGVVVAVCHGTQMLRKEYIPATYEVLNLAKGWAVLYRKGATVTMKPKAGQVFWQGGNFQGNLNLLAALVAKHDGLVPRAGWDWRASMAGDITESNAYGPGIEKIAGTPGQSAIRVTDPGRFAWYMQNVLGFQARKGS